jgi:hypothetical protein
VIARWISILDMRWSRLPVTLLAAVALISATTKAGYPHACASMAAVTTSAPAHVTHDAHAHHEMGAEVAHPTETPEAPETPSAPCDCATDCCCTAGPSPWRGPVTPLPAATIIGLAMTAVTSDQGPRVSTGAGRLPWATGPPTHGMA